MHNCIFYFKTLPQVVYFAKFNQNVFMKYSCLFLLILVFVSCTNEDMKFQIGSDYLDVRTNIRFIDTLTVASYTVRMDSIRTSNYNMEEPWLVTGRYYDPEIGYISARSYFRVNHPSSLSMPNNAVYDSLQLIMICNGYSLGDTNTVYTINVRRLSKAMKPRSDGYFYNTSKTLFDTVNILGTKSFIPRPNTHDTVRIRLDDNLGNALFNLIDEGDQIVKERELFQNYFKGFAIDYDINNEALLAFDFPTREKTNNNVYYPVMRLYYHYFDFENVNKYFDFLIGYENVQLQYNQYLVDPLIDFPVKQRDMLPAQETGNSTYVQAGTGIVTRLEIPYLKNLLALHNNIIIMKAELQIEPVRNTYKVFKLPENVQLYGTDRINRFETSFVTDGVLSLDNIYQEETFYTFDVTRFIKSKIIEETDETPALLFIVSPEKLYKSLDRIVLGSQLHAENRVKLKIYYINYE